MLSCQENIIGIRGACNETAPTSGLYIEDLPGLNLQKVADFTEDRSGVDLMTTALNEAFRLVDRSIMYFPNEQFDSASNYAKNSLFRANLGFTKTLDTGAIDSSFSAVIRKTSDFQFSNLNIEFIFVKVQTALSGVVFSIDDGVSVQVLDPVDLVADEVTTIPANIKLASFDFTISADLSGTNVYLAQKYEVGCGSCGTVKRHPYMDITAVDGISCRVLTECNQDAVVCFAYDRYTQTLPDAVRLQAGIYLYKQFRVSSRANNVQNYDLPLLTAQIEEWEKEYNAIIQSVMPNILTNIRRNDKFCYDCGGWMSNQLVP